MAVFDLEASLVRAEKKFGRTSSRTVRSDRGRSRLPPEVQAELERLLNGHERPAVRHIMETLRERCFALAVRAPARATIYEAMARTPTKSYPIAELPAAPRQALYNLDETVEVPGHQLAFYCFNYGDLGAVSFAAGLPWLALYQAARLPGWRARSRGLLEAVLTARGIS